MRKKWLFKYVLPVFIITLLAGGVALAQGGYTLGRGPVAGGGYIVSTGPPYSLGGTIGQPDAGSMSGSGAGGDFTLGGGFWGGGASSSTYRIYLPLILKNYP
jgi:hypothetical protein